MYVCFLNIFVNYLTRPPDIVCRKALINVFFSFPFGVRAAVTRLE